MMNIELKRHGLVIAPDMEELRDALLLLINDRQLRSRIGIRAYETASGAFSLTKWQNYWRKIIKQA